MNYNRRPAERMALPMPPLGSENQPAVTTGWQQTPQRFECRFRYWICGATAIFQTVRDPQRQGARSFGPKVTGSIPCTAHTRRFHSLSGIVVPGVVEECRRL